VNETDPMWLSGDVKRIMRSAGLGLTLVIVAGAIGAAGMIIATFVVIATIGSEGPTPAVAVELAWFASLFVATAYAFGFAAIIELLRGIFWVLFRDSAGKKPSATTPP